MNHLPKILGLLLAILFSHAALAQTINTSNVQIEWKVENRFRFFKDAETFTAHETAWRQYLQHVDAQHLNDEDEARLIATTSVLGAEHVLNDRYIPFSQHLRTKYDWRGWAARHADNTCWDKKSRSHSACSGVENYLEPKSHRIKIWLRPLQSNKLLNEFNCEWRVNDGPAQAVPCDTPAELDIPYPTTATVSVNVEGEQAISTEVAVKDLLIVGFGDSFASGEGNPDVPVTMSDEARFKTYYPRRVKNDVSGNAQWTDEICHRSLYGHQLRAALQVGIENPKASVTFLGYACSGAAVEEGILGPQTYVDYKGVQNNNGEISARSVTGGRKDTQLHWLMRELCREKLNRAGDIWTCPNNAFRRKVDFLFLSIGGNDIGFSSLVGWATLRSGATSRLAKWFGATVSPKQFTQNMREILPGAYVKLAKAIETAVPLKAPDLGYDASRVVLSAYPDILEDETGSVCKGNSGSEDEHIFAANQSLNFFASWLVVSQDKLGAAHSRLEQLHKRMGELAEDNGWTFAGRAYEGKPFRGHGFCAKNAQRTDDAVETLVLPCRGKADSPTQDCKANLSGKERGWRPFNPATQNYPYGLRQRWVRTFNDAYMIINQKVIGPNGQIDERASNTVFSETTGAMHPSAEGHAAMADAILLDIRDKISQHLESGN